jgi:hypothetical protein
MSALPLDHGDIAVNAIENKLSARLEKEAQLGTEPGKFAKIDLAALLAKAKELLAKYRPILLILSPDQYDLAVNVILDLILRDDEEGHDPEPRRRAAPKHAPKADPA